MPLLIKVATVLQPARRRGMYEFHACHCIACNAPYWQADRLSAQWDREMPPVLRVDACTGESIGHACPNCGKLYPIPMPSYENWDDMETAAAHVPLTFEQSWRVCCRTRIQCYETTNESTGMIRTLYAGGFRFVDPNDLGSDVDPAAIPSWHPWARAV